MTELYHLRLTDRFVFYDPEHGSHVFRTWPEGAIVADPEIIKFLESKDAPVEKIAANNSTRSS